MTTESGLKLRTKLESAKTLKFENKIKGKTYMEGEMIVVGSTIGALIERVGAPGQPSSEDFPNGPDGILVYEAERIVLPKMTGPREDCSVGDRIYYNSEYGAISCLLGKGNTPCGRALEDVLTSDSEILIDLMVLT